MLNIAIDGPSGAGKSSIARAVAKKMGIIYVDTGAMYRSVGLYMKRNGIDISDAAAVEAALPLVSVSLGYNETGEQRVYLGKEDVSAAIRENEISAYASVVSSIPAVRTFLLDLQRDMAKEHDVIMDGRDIGTVILPDAQVKIFMSAAPEARAQRRVKELREKGQNVDYEQILAEMIERDERDRNREIAPAVAAPDAIHFDNSTGTFEENVEKVYQIIADKINK